MSTITAAHIRRAALALTPVLAAAGCIIGGIADPIPEATGLKLVETYTNNWDAVQWKSTSYHYGYMFFGAAALGLAALVRQGRGVTLALIAGALALFGTATLPGMLVTDFYASAGGQIVGPEKMYEIEQATQTGWGGAAIMIPGMLGFVLCLPLAALAAVRARLVRWYAPVLVLGGIASIPLGLTVSQEAGFIVMATCFGLLGACIARIPVAAFGGRAGRDLADDPTVDAAANEASVRDEPLVAV